MDLSKIYQRIGDRSGGRISERISEMNHLLDGFIRCLYPNWPDYSNLLGPYLLSTIIASRLSGRDLRRFRGVAEITFSHEIDYFLRVQNRGHPFHQHLDDISDKDFLYRPVRWTVISILSNFMSKFLTENVGICSILLQFHNCFLITGQGIAMCFLK